MLVIVLEIQKCGLAKKSSTTTASKCCQFDALIFILNIAITKITLKF